MVCIKKYIVILLIAIFLIPNNVLSESIFYGDYNEDLFLDYVDIPVVAATDNSGILGQVRIARIAQGFGNIIFDQRVDIDFSTMNSVINAVRFASKYSDEKYDYFISYDLSTERVSGKSTGAAITLGLISLHLEKEYDTNYVVTGNIDKFGYLRAVGGLPLKIAVISQSDNKPNLIIAPNQQIGTIKLFDKNIQRYTKQFVDVKKHAKSNNVNLFEKNTIDTIMSLVLKD